MDPSGPNEPGPLPLPEGAVDDDVLMGEVVAVLSSSTSVAPPPAMRDRVLAALDSTPQLAALPREQAPAGVTTVHTVAEPQAPHREPAPSGAAEVGDLDAARARREARPTRRSALRGLALGGAVAAAGVVVGAAGVGAWLTSRTDPQSFAAVRARVESAPDVRAVKASDATGAWSDTELRYSERLGQAVVVASKALPPASGGVYQLWRQADAASAPTPLDTFSGEDGVVVAGGVAGAAALAVSRERGAGATAPTSPVLAHYFLDA